MRSESSLIKNRTYMSQIKDFTELQFGKIYPTDIDGFIDFKNTLFIFIEIKYGESNMKYGQKLAIERLCDACQTIKRNSFAIIATHQDKSDINVSGALVKTMRFKGEWRIPLKTISVKKAIERILQKFSNPVD